MLAVAWVCRAENRRDSRRRCIIAASRHSHRDSTPGFGLRALNARPQKRDLEHPDSFNLGHPNRDACGNVYRLTEGFHLQATQQRVASSREIPSWLGPFLLVQGQADLLDANVAEVALHPESVPAFGNRRTNPHLAQSWL